jgi:RHS repeat-associated protein
LSPQYDTLWYIYCGVGKRIKKIEKPHGENPDTTSYAYDGIYVVCEFGGHLDLSAKYVYANGMLLARYDASPADTHYYHHDGLGSIIGMTNENGWVEQSYFYDEFGILLGSWGTTSNHYLYTGQEYDSEMSGTELYNLRARYYRAEIGRFMSEDPVLVSRRKSCPVLQARYPPQGLNKYAYVRNNSMNYSDPTGLSIYGPIPENPIWPDFCKLCYECQEQARSTFEENIEICEKNYKECMDYCKSCPPQGLKNLMSESVCKFACLQEYAVCRSRSYSTYSTRIISCTVAYCIPCYAEQAYVPWID